MKRITDLYHSLEKQELYKDGKELVNPLGASLGEDERERILKRACSLIEEEPSERRRFQGKRLVLLAAAAILALGALTVSAGEYVKIHPELAEFLGISSEAPVPEIHKVAMDLETASDSGKNWKLEDEENGLKVSAKQVVNDGEIVYIYFQFQLPEGIYEKSTEEHKKMFHFDQCSFQMEGGEEKALGGVILKESRSDPGNYYAVGEIDSLQDFERKQEISITFQNFGYVDAAEDSTKWVDVIEGQWELNWELEYKNAAVNYPVEKEIPVETGMVAIENIRVSPLSVKVTATTDSKEPVLSDQISIEGIIMEDGVHKEVMNYGYVGPEGDKLVMGWVFEDMIPVEKIKGVMVNGEKLILPGEREKTKE